LKKKKNFFYKKQNRKYKTLETNKQTLLLFNSLYNLNTKVTISKLSQTINYLGENKTEQLIVELILSISKKSAKQISKGTPTLPFLQVIIWNRTSGIIWNND